MTNKSGKNRGAFAHSPKSTNSEPGVEAGADFTSGPDSVDLWLPTVDFLLRSLARVVSSTSDSHGRAEDQEHRKHDTFPHLFLPVHPRRGRILCGTALPPAHPFEQITVVHVDRTVGVFALHVVRDVGAHLPAAAAGATAAGVPSRAGVTGRCELRVELFVGEAVDCTACQVDRPDHASMATKGRKDVQVRSARCAVDMLDNILHASGLVCLW